MKNSKTTVKVGRIAVRLDEQVYVAGESTHSFHVDNVRFMGKTNPRNSGGGGLFTHTTELPHYPKGSPFASL